MGQNINGGLANTLEGVSGELLFIFFYVFFDISVRNVCTHKRIKRKFSKDLRKLYSYSLQAHTLLYYSGTASN